MIDGRVSVVVAVVELRLRSRDCCRTDYDWVLKVKMRYIRIGHVKRGFDGTVGISVARRLQWCIWLVSGMMGRWSLTLVSSVICTIAKVEREDSDFAIIEAMKLQSALFH